MNNGIALPLAVITPNEVLRAIGEKPGCGMRHLHKTLIMGKQGGTLEQVRKNRDGLKHIGLITTQDYQHNLTSAGEKAFLLLPSKAVEETAQLQEPAMA